MVTIDGVLAAAIEEWRRRQPDLPCRGEAIRRLIARGMKDEERRRWSASDQPEPWPDITSSPSHDHASPRL